MDSGTYDCMFHNWYHKFHHVTFKSEIIPLPISFVDYLNEDGVFMPASAFPKYEKDPFDLCDDGEWSDEGETDDGQQPHVPDFPEVEKAISDTIEKFGGYAFPKLNWSSPKDASWMTVSGNLKCQTPHDIFLLLKSSDFINYDLEQLALLGDKEQTQPAMSSCTLVLRKWYDLQQSMEFRCFVCNDILVGISQRDHTNFYPFLMGDVKEKVQSNIQEFFVNHIQHQFPAKNCINS